MFAQPAFAPRSTRKSSQATTSPPRGDRSLYRRNSKALTVLLRDLPHGSSSNSMAVVDEDTLVIGLRGMRVVNSSIMPSSDRQSECANDHDRRDGIRSHSWRQRLAPSNQPYYLATNWEASQR